MTAVSGLEQRMVALFDQPGVVVLALAVALGVGALHALAPGHGKSITAAYLVGAKARPADALVLGAIVAAMHTVSVVALGVGWVALSATSVAGTEVLTAWLQVVAALVVVGVGVHLVRTRWHGRGDPHGHHHGHSHDHGHAHEHAHTHDGAHREGASPWSRRGLVALGLSGGLLPSPSAFLVLVSGLLTGRVGYAAALVAAFGIGMAATLAAVGLVTLRGRALLTAGGARWAPVERVAHQLPTVAAAGVLVGGAVYLVLAASAVAAA